MVFAGEHSATIKKAGWTREQVQRYVFAGSNFKTLADSSFAAEQYGLAVKKGNADLLAKLNKGLADVKGDGTYNTIYAKYFGAAPGAAAAATPATPASK